MLTGTILARVILSSRNTHGPATRILTRESNHRSKAYMPYQQNPGSAPRRILMAVNNEPGEDT